MVERLLATCLQSIMADYKHDDSLSESSDFIQSEAADFNKEFVRDQSLIFLVILISNTDKEFEGLQFDIEAEDIQWTLWSEPSASADLNVLTDMPQPGPTINIPAKVKALLFSAFWEMTLFCELWSRQKLILQRKDMSTGELYSRS